MDQDESLSDALFRIRALVDNHPPSDAVLQREAYFAWRRRGEGEGSDLGDWFTVRRELVANDEFGELDRWVKRAEDNGDHRLALELTVIRNLAILLDMRPTDIGPGTDISSLSMRRIQLVVAGVARDRNYHFSRQYCYAQHVSELIAKLWDYEYRDFTLSLRR